MLTNRTSPLFTLIFASWCEIWTWRWRIVFSSGAGCNSSAARPACPLSLQVHWVGASIREREELFQLGEMLQEEQGVVKGQGRAQAMPQPAAGEAEPLLPHQPQPPHPWEQHMGWHVPWAGMWVWVSRGFKAHRHIWAAAWPQEEEGWGWWWCQGCWHGGAACPGAFVLSSNTSISGRSAQDVCGAGEAALKALTGKSRFQPKNGASPQGSCQQQLL